MSKSVQDLYAIEIPLIECKFSSMNTGHHRAMLNIDFACIAPAQTVAASPPTNNLHVEIMNELFKKKE